MVLDCTVVPSINQIRNESDVLNHTIALSCLYWLSPSQQ